MPIKCFETKLKLQGGKLILPRSYIYATRITPADTFWPFARRAQSEAGWGYHEIDASHAPNVTAPEALMRLLQEIVAHDAWNWRGVRLSNDRAAITYRLDMNVVRLFEAGEQETLALDATGWPVPRDGADGAERGTLHWAALGREPINCRAEGLSVSLMHR
jgi:hypothetical protein